ncbi:hypothetical protein FML05_25545 [Klebsiella variicola]|uniref:hypothetical protein n=1 Tax=Klebsiella pneumoniae complex TaxID=3390273 RepID=UPI001155058E|nr:MULTISPECIES: hypothetical protein [Klebsiella]MBZ7597566.1 hypothetical protein [Klebsiella variicola]MDU5052610.1 hypothetical protein [Klebsiella variicola]
MNHTFIQGHNRPQKEVSGNEIIHGLYQGAVNVVNGELTIAGMLQGSLHVSTGSKVIIIGTHQGSISVESGALVIVEGGLQGSSHVHRNATIIVEPTGHLLGSLNNQGTLVVRGMIGGERSGHGTITFEGQGYIMQPRIENGTHYYDV